MTRFFRTLLKVVAVAFVAAVATADTVPPKPAPNWKLMDVDGHEVRFEQFKGKVVVIDFWATWCAPCRAELPGYIALQDKYRGDGLVIVGISVDRLGPKVVKKFIADHGMNYQVVMGDDEVQEAFGGMDGIPTTFIIDRAGNIRDRKTGAAEAGAYEAVVRKYLEK
ncbi:MAG: Redoxin domain protein [Verrucomicrobia bacterium]|nr:Redoxin domain protein [Verrucomicrobiota bacterium]